MKPSEYVGKVAEELQSNGWIQHAMHNENGSCVMGAMAAVTMRELRDIVGTGVPQAAHRLMAARLRERGFNGIPAWNDVKGRTFNEVRDFLHECQIGLKEIEE
jgi:hypothetical protein